MATAAAEEAPGKGIMEVQKVTGSSGPAQPNGLPSAYNDIRQRPVPKGKSKLGQVVSEVSLHSSKAGDLASKKAAEKPENAGVDSEQGRPDWNLLKVKRDGVGAVNRANSPRQKTGYARLGSQQEPMKDGMEAVAVQNKEDDKVPMLQAPAPQSIQDSESVLDIVETKKLNGAMEMETKTNTHSNLSLENTESSLRNGVDSEQGRPDKNILKVIKDGVGAVHRANSPRHMTGYARLGRQPEGMKDDMEDVPSSESPVVTGGTTDTENSSPSQENAESSCKSKTAEWALLVTSVVLEATSASCDQLGYALTSMVMAFVALLLSILDLILKARGREITCDGRGLLPCFNHHSSHELQNPEPFAGVVQYFSLAGALWQCSFTTVGYNYTHHKLVNPIKLCLLPFILAFCLLISKVVKSSQRARLDSNAD